MYILNFKSHFLQNRKLFCKFLFILRNIHKIIYRKKLLVGQLKDDMKQLLLNITYNSDFEIEVFESDFDHYI